MFDGVGVVSGDGVGVGAGVGGAGAFELGEVRIGWKLTVPKLKSFLESYIDWLMADSLVVPHQLYPASTLLAASK
jgi:hypothetical protein